LKHTGQCGPLRREQHSGRLFRNLNRLCLSKGMDDGNEQFEKLSRIKFELEEQDTLLLEHLRRAPYDAITDAQIAIIKAIFEEANLLIPGLIHPFASTDDAGGMRPQMRSARARVDEQIAKLQKTMKTPNRAVPATTTDPRRVVVVYGRNAAARNALFSFLRSINLDPIEWGEAIRMTSNASPYIGDALNHAFANSQAAVVLLSGDDLARLGTRFIEDSDGTEERNLTPQPRPNVLFEAGLALGIHPERTVIVQIGRTRSFSDILGRHIIHLNNLPDCRHELVSRLKTAGCDVRVEGKTDWLHEGDFDAGAHHPDVDAKSARQTTAHSPPKASASDSKPANPLLADGAEEFIADSPDDFSLKITRYEDNGGKGLLLGVENRRLSAIAPYRMRILSARSFDSRQNDYRDGRLFNAFSGTVTKPIEASCPGENIWLVRKKPDSSHLTAGNQNANFLEWPASDKSYLQRWLLSIDVSTQTIPKPNTNAIPLTPIALQIVVIWNPEKNEFFIEEP
jgi:predicted nucleotide-binding protein